MGTSDATGTAPTVQYVYTVSQHVSYCDCARTRGGYCYRVPLHGIIRRWPMELNQITDGSYFRATFQPKMVTFTACVAFRDEETVETASVDLIFAASAVGPGRGFAVDTFYHDH